MIYAEFITRDRNLPLEMFRHFGRQDWQSDKDTLVANLGRTMKIGPEPQALCWWKIAGMVRMDEWEAHFKTAEGRLYMAESPVARALNFYRCGLYDIVSGGDPVGPGLHVVEFFDPEGRTAEQLRESFGARLDRRGALAAILTRIGLLGPDPGGMALWTFPDYVSAEPFLRAASGPTCRVHAVGLYRNIGDEIP